MTTTPIQAADIVAAEWPDLHICPHASISRAVGILCAHARSTARDGDEPPPAHERTATVVLPGAQAGRGAPWWPTTIPLALHGVAATADGVDVDVDGDLVEDVDRLEAGALAVLAAVTAHRQMARSDTEDGE